MSNYEKFGCGLCRESKCNEDDTCTCRFSGKEINSLEECAITTYREYEAQIIGDWNGGMRGKYFRGKV